VIQLPFAHGNGVRKTEMGMNIRAALCAGLTLYACAAVAQPAGLTAEQHQWIKCFTSERWCVAASTDKITRKSDPIAMVTAHKPFYFHRFLSRATLQLACENGRPILMLGTGRPISWSDLSLRYRIDPKGTIGTAIGKHAGSGSVFSIVGSLVNDMEAGAKATVEVTLDSDHSVSSAEFDVRGMPTILKRLGCAE
jgi:hypothetical protein